MKREKKKTPQDIKYRIGDEEDYDNTEKFFARRVLEKKRRKSRKEKNNRPNSTDKSPAGSYLRKDQSIIPAHALRGEVTSCHRHDNRDKRNGKIILFHIFVLMIN